MKATEGQIGRIFVIRLEDGDELPGCVERYAREKGVAVGHAVLVGGIGGGEIVVGPRNSTDRPPQPMLLPIDGAHEVVATGVLAPNEAGDPVLHIHGSLGRSGSTVSGCLRPGVTTWLVGEVVLYEILGATVTRRHDEESGFALLTPVENEKASAQPPTSPPPQPPKEAAAPEPEKERPVEAGVAAVQDGEHSEALFLCNARLQ